MIKILAIDGGGIRGIIPALLLAELERRTGQPIARLFDLVAGTSTGGILALGLTIPKTPAAPLYRAQQFVEMYAREGPRIFSRSLWHRLTACDHLIQPKYSAGGIQQVLEEYFGDARLRDAATQVLITSYEIEQSFPFFFRSSMARERMDYDFPARDVARATSAAPTYFEPMKLLTGTVPDHYTLIDGGVFANNPAACALVEARTTHPGARDFLVVSLGTGELNRSLPYDGTRNWGVARWAMPMLDTVFDGVSRTVDYQLRQLLPGAAGEPKRYYRFQTTLDAGNHRLDNASPENITALKGLALRLIENESEELDELCEALAQPKLG
ncbi:MAG: patatin-like phospholipase family protein [Acidobacteriia bacterium]|nr:patatin-like phospholipase family protein [Terriglobia bacterium]